ncbi:single-stranded DNA-binding protein [Leucobacter chromiiresistens]|uniref:Single-stranded DNA-binding protein n=1 Tax=Leucobacter chromiiresistens TaxID=1079994 RepID=A0A147EQF0_9MICO|nr:single-stranded DNA-binding protein [Leucobacter chromiiresistens]KTR86613.1 single-stranded DNA-binding protein [Leucobacter chromiiresistens]
MSTTVTVIGTIATDPRTISAPGKATFCTLRLASTDRRFDREQNQWVDGETNWFTVNAFRSLASHAGASFQKGQRVVVHGRLRVRRWETDEKSGTSVEIEADAIGHDLRWGVTAFSKRTPAEPETGDNPDPETSDRREELAAAVSSATPHGWPGEASEPGAQQSPDTESDAGAPASGANALRSAA